MPIKPVTPSFEPPDPDTRKRDDPHKRRASRWTVVAALAAIVVSALIVSYQNVSSRPWVMPIINDLSQTENTSTERSDTGYGPQINGAFPDTQMLGLVAPGDAPLDREPASLEPDATARRLTGFSRTGLMGTEEFSIWQTTPEDLPRLMKHFVSSAQLLGFTEMADPQDHTPHADAPATRRLVCRGNIMTQCLTLRPSSHEGEARLVVWYIGGE